MCAPDVLNLVCEATSVSDPASLLPPAGWYPDPGGERQWRAWTGREWADATAPFGDQAPSPARHLEAIHAHETLLHYGIAVYYAGIGLVINAYHFRPEV